MEKAALFMKKHGMAAENIDVCRYSRVFCEHAERGLSAKQDELPMIPAYLSCTDNVPRDMPAAVIDAGGTNFRTALVRFSGGTAVFEGLRKHEMPGAAKPATWDEFIEQTADGIAPLLDKTDRIGFCFSYPMEVTPEKDAVVTELTKQVRIDGACGKLLGRDLTAALEARGYFGKRIVVLNDTPATLLGGSAHIDKTRFGGFIGLVAGTGLNTCCALPARRIKKLGLTGDEKMLVNLESGSFGGFERGDFDIEMDKTLPDTGRYIAEKMVSGRYLGLLCLHTLKGAAREGLLSAAAADCVLGMDALETAVAGAWCSGDVPSVFSDDDKLCAGYIIRELFDRAARCTASQLAGIMLLTGENNVCISIDGSLYKRNELFSSCLRRHLDSVGKSYEIVTQEETSLLGAAAAALMN